jgi:hypothetical protein
MAPPLQSLGGMGTSVIDTRRIWMVVFFLALANLFLFVAYYWLSQSEPITDLRMGVSTQGLVIRGKNYAGLTRFRVFHDWNAALHYIEEHNHQMPEIVDVPAQAHWDAKLEGAKIFWGAQGDSMKVLSTPSEEVAKNLLPFVRYNVIEASSMGFSLPLQFRVQAD